MDDDKQVKCLDIRPFQETLGGGYCGPASLKMIMDYYGVEKSEEELAVMCNRDPDLGVDDKAIKKTAEKLGFKVEIQNHSSLDHISEWLNKKTPVIVNWFTKGRCDYPEDEVADGHYSVVIGLDNEFVYLQDPEVGRMRKIDRKDFYRVWFDFSSENINKWEDMIIRQIIVVYRQP